MAIEFEVKLSDGVTAPAGSAAHQVDVLQRQLRSLQTQMIKANALGNEKAFAKAAGDYGKLSAQVEQLGGVRMPAANKQTVSMAQAVKSVGASAMATATAVMAAVAAVVAFAAAVGKAIVAVADMAQQRKQIEATFTALGAGAFKGEQAAAMFDRLGRVLPITTSTMAEFGQQIATAGIRDMAKMEQAIKAAAASSAILGDTSGKAGSKIVGLVVDIQKAIKLRQGIGDIANALEGTGINADEVARSMGITERQLKSMAASGVQLNKIGNAIQDALIKKGVEPMRVMMASFEVMGRKVKDTIAGLFSGVAGTAGFKQFSEQMLRLLDLFASGTSQGKLAKQGMTSAFDAIFRVAAIALRELRLGVLKTEIEVLKLYISFKPALRTLREWGERISAAQAMSSGFVSILTLVGKGIYNLSSGLRTAVTATFAVAAGLTFLMGKLTALYDTIVETVSPWVDLFLDLGKDMISGLIKGIKNGAIAVKDAVVNLGSGAIDAFKGKLGIKSPSLVFAGLGAQTTAGYSQGVRQSAPAAMAATRDMASKASEGGKVAVERAPAAKSAKGGMTINVGGITIEGGGGSPVELLEEAVVSLFERVALTQGVA